MDRLRTRQALSPRLSGPIREDISVEMLAVIPAVCKPGRFHEEIYAEIVVRIPAGNYGGYSLANRAAIPTRHSAGYG